MDIKFEDVYSEILSKIEKSAKEYLSKSTEFPITTTIQDGDIKTTYKFNKPDCSGNSKVDVTVEAPIKKFCIEFNIEK